MERTKKQTELALLANQVNNASPENNNDPENISSFKYHDIDEMYNVGVPNKNKSLSPYSI